MKATRISWLGIAAVLGTALLLGCDQAGAGIAQSVSQERIQRLLDQEEGPLLLDVRTPEEFGSGHVPGAINIPHTDLRARLDEIEPHRDGEVVVYCERGGRAGKAAEILLDAGFQDIGHLEGDMAGWRDAGLPVEP